MHLGGAGTGFPAGHHDHYWLNLVCEGHEIVRDFVSAFLHGAGRPDLWGQVARDWRLMEQGQFIDTWTSRSGWVPNGLALEVDITQRREGEVNPAQWTLLHGGRLILTKQSSIEFLRPLSGAPKPDLGDLGTGISLHFHDVVWVGLTPGTDD